MLPVFVACFIPNSLYFLVLYPKWPLPPSLSLLVTTSCSLFLKKESVSFFLFFFYIVDSIPVVNHLRGIKERKLKFAMNKGKDKKVKENRLRKIILHQAPLFWEALCF